YEWGYYTKREAAVIGTTFSVVSITFCLVIISEVHLESMFIPFYLTVTFTGVILAFIMPRIPPLSNIPDTYYVQNKNNNLDRNIPEGYSLLSWGYQKALERAKRNSGFSFFIRDGIQNVLDMWLGVAPIVMAIGTIALIIAEYTPFFSWLGIP